jgi:hypothetical protein
MSCKFKMELRIYNMLLESTFVSIQIIIEGRLKSKFLIIFNREEVNEKKETHDTFSPWVLGNTAKKNQVVGQHAAEQQLLNMEVPFRAILLQFFKIGACDF